MSSNNIFELIVKTHDEMTRSELLVADYVLSHRSEIPYIMSKDLADACGVSEATITRFCHKIGCMNYNNFKLCAAQAISAAGSSEQEGAYGSIQPSDSIEQKCKKLFHINTQALQQTYEMLDYAQISRVVDSLYNASSVYCFGQGNTSIIAMDAWGRFATVTSKFHWISNFHMQVITAATLGADDVILYFSFSGSMRELSELGRIVRQTQAKLILITRFPKSPGAKFADLLLICGADETPDQQGSVAVKLGHLFIIDILFHEYCARDYEKAEKTRGRTLDAIAPMLL